MYNAFIIMYIAPYVQYRYCYVYRSVFTVPLFLSDFKEILIF